MRRFFIATFLIILLPIQVFSAVGFFSLLPNPSGDDTLGEYIEIRNTGCDSIDISGYTLSDASGKTYVILSGTTVQSRENIRFPYATTKIALNNSGNESVILKDSGGVTVDEISYSGIQKDNVVITFLLTDEDCTFPESTNSGSTDSGTGIPLETGDSEILADSGVLDQAPIEFFTGGLNTETGSLDNSSGSTESSSGVMDNSGSIFSGSGSIFSDSGNIEAGSGLTGTGVVSSSTPEENSETGTTEQNPPNSLSQEGIRTGSTGTGVIEAETPLIPPSEGGSGTPENIYIETGALAPLEMYYFDSDNNARVDTLEIVYPYILTGVVNTGAIELYSNTGGLFSYRVNTLTGYVTIGYVSGNILVLRLLEGDKDTTTLKVNNTTSSELRLKSSSDLGFRSIGGQVPEDFFLTKSFDSYKKVSKKYEVGSMNSETGTGTPLNPTLQGESGTTETGIVNFPDIIPTFQNYTNTTNSGDTLTCTTMPCRVNFTLEPIFTGSLAAKDFSCKITFGTGVYTTCNPPQLYPTSSGSIEVVLTHKESGKSTGKVLAIMMNMVSSSSNVVAGATAPIDNHAPIVNIDMDGKWKKYFTSPEINLLRCYAFTCSVNFTGENSYDPDGDEIRFFWLYDYRETSSKKDPGTRTFTIGNHTVILRVIDIYGATGEQKYLIEVIHPDYMPEEEMESEEKKTKIKEKKEKVVKKEKSEKKKKSKPMMFFDIPDILLQNKNPENIQIAGNQYRCYTKTKTCSINFTLTGAQKGYVYEWSFPGQSGSYISKNPRSFAFPVGSSDVGLVVRDLAGNIFSEQKLQIQVIKTTKTRGTAGKKAEKESGEKKKVEEVSEDFSMPNIPQEGENAPLLFLVFISGSGLAGYVRTRKRER